MKAVGVIALAGVVLAFALLSASSQTSASPARLLLPSQETLVVQVQSRCANRCQNRCRGRHAKCLGTCMRTCK
jgi:hypothetical protein